MKTILDFASVFFLKTLLAYSHVMTAVPAKAKEVDTFEIMEHTVWQAQPGIVEKHDWRLEVYQSADSGILHLNIPHSDEKLWFFQVFCPTEWNMYPWLESYTLKTPRHILSDASATTYPQISRMKEFQVDRPLPSYLDFSNQGINVVMTLFLEPDQKVLDEIGAKILAGLDNL